MKQNDRIRVSPAVRELLELWDEQLLAAWFEAQMKGGWHRHVGSEATWPSPASPPV